MRSARIHQETIPASKTWPRLGLCCQFAKEPVKFRTTTATAMLQLSRSEHINRLAQLCHSNADALMGALQFCAAHGIGAFRVNSQDLPIKTHPQAGYDLAALPGGHRIITRFRDCGKYARENDLRLSFHPDQFVVLNSPNQLTLDRSLAELDYQAEVAEWIGADTINLHGGGAYGDKPAALRTLRKNIAKLPDPVRSRLTLENDDKVFTPQDLLPVCEDLNVPLVYDVHHHRCRLDGLSVAEATERAIAAWDREPLFHISSPLDGWNKPRPERHHDYINLRDFPSEWKNRMLTIEVEAKAKELAVLRLLAWLRQNKKATR